MPPATRGRRPVTSPAGASAQESAEGVKTVTVNVTDTETKSYPDVSELWAEHVELNGERALVSEWIFMRATEVTFGRDKSLSEVRAWVYLDDEPFVYLVRAWRKRENRRAAQFEILGVARRDTWTVIGTTIEQEGGDPE